MKLNDGWPTKRYHHSFCNSARSLQLPPITVKGLACTVHYMKTVMPSCLSLQMLVSSGGPALSVPWAFQSNFPPVLWPGICSRFHLTSTNLEEIKAGLWKNSEFWMCHLKITQISTKVTFTKDHMLDVHHFHLQADSLRTTEDWQWKVIVSIKQPNAK